MAAMLLCPCTNSCRQLSKHPFITTPMSLKRDRCLWHLVALCLQVKRRYGEKELSPPLWSVERNHWRKKWGGSLCLACFCAEMDNVPCKNVPPGDANRMWGPSMQLQNTAVGHRALQYLLLPCKNTANVDLDRRQNLIGIQFLTYLHLNWSVIASQEYLTKRWKAMLQLEWHAI